jgi:NADH:ubiquinone oxidoreductase subunit 3 (subunit A)
MDWLATWWHDEVVGGHKGPLLLAFVAFVVTFLATRTITRLIRAGRGPFHNMSSGGTHQHHSTPGTILLVTGAFTAVGADGRAPLDYIAAAVIGIGASLVLDEFAMIFHLQDVYWSQEGQLSVNVVTLVAACVGLAVVGVSPTEVPGLSDTTRYVRLGVTGALVVHFLLVAVVALKGKFPTAVIGTFAAPIAWYAAARLAAPLAVGALVLLAGSGGARCAQGCRVREAVGAGAATVGRLHRWPSVPTRPGCARAWQAPLSRSGHATPIATRLPDVSPYVVIAAVVVVGLLLFVAAMGARAVLAPRAPTRAKLTTYESGVDPVGVDWAQTQVRYFVYAFLYVIFAVDAVYLFPWALVVRSSHLGAVSLVEIAVFVGVLLVGLVHAGRRGLLRWV